MYVNSHSFTKSRLLVVRTRVPNNQNIRLHNWYKQLLWTKSMLASMEHVMNFDQTFIPVLYDDQNLVKGHIPYLIIIVAVHGTSGVHKSFTR